MDFINDPWNLEEYNTNIISIVNIVYLGTNNVVNHDKIVINKNLTSPADV